MRVRQLMNRNVITIRETNSALEAVTLMHRARVRHLPVLDDDGALVGVVTDRDVRHHLFHPRVQKQVGRRSIQRLLSEVPVSEIMSGPVISIDVTDDIADAARLMLQNYIGSLPVLEGGRLIGIITETDLLRDICRADAACSPEVAHVVVSNP